MGKNPYDFDYKNLPDSKEVTDPVTLIKMELGAKFCKITEKMETNEVLEATGLHKADLSRIKVGAIERFSLSRLISLLNTLGYSAKIKVTKSQEAS